MADRKPRARPEPLLFSVPTAAALLGISPKACWRLIALRALPHVRLGSRVFVVRTVLLSLLQQLPGVTTAEALSRLADLGVAAGYRAEMVETTDTEETPG